MILLLLGQVAYGFGVCIDIATNFTDNGGTDYFQGNGPNNARYVKIGVTYLQQSSGTYVTESGYADSTGCFQTGLAQGDLNLTVSVQSEIKRSGVTAKAFPGTPTGFNNESPAIVAWFVATPTGSIKNYTIPASQVWNQVMLASFSWHRTGSIHLNQHSTASRDCCLSGEDDDGSCLPSSSDRYTDFGTPNEIRMYAGGNSCGGSSYACDVNGDGWVDNSNTEKFGCPGVMVSCAQRMVIVHEQGHVVVEQRMGRRSNINNLNLFVPINDPFLRACIGQHDPFTPALLAGWDLKGELKEDMQATAAREGWASFYSAWVFNKRWQANCTYANDLTLYDYDLDGGDSINGFGAATVDVVNMDNDYANPGLYDCHNHGVGDLGEPDPNDPTATWTTGDDWLEAASSGNHCSLLDGSLDDRGTAYDWASFFWRMSNTAEGQGVSLAELSDLYVDMCPTSWHTDRAAASNQDRRVMNRLLQSAAANFLTTEVSNERHRGQDH